MAGTKNMNGRISARKGRTGFALDRKKTQWSVKVERKGVVCVFAWFSYSLAGGNSDDIYFLLFFFLGIT